MCREIISAAWRLFSAHRKLRTSGTHFLLQLGVEKKINFNNASVTSNRFSDEYFFSQSVILSIERVLMLSGADCKWLTGLSGF